MRASRSLDRPTSSGLPGGSARALMGATSNRTKESSSTRLRMAHLPGHDSVDFDRRQRGSRDGRVGPVIAGTIAAALEGSKPGGELGARLPAQIRLARGLRLIE